jgi:flavin reductase (DIM6/NTAB) family NADH-FMN oxidoreductase RutF
MTVPTQADAFIPPPAVTRPRGSAVESVGPATGAPYCSDALAAFDCELIEVHEAGTHSLLIGQVLATAQDAVSAEIHHRQQYETTRAL